MLTFSTGDWSAPFSPKQIWRLVALFYFDLLGSFSYSLSNLCVQCSTLQESQLHVLYRFMCAGNVFVNFSTGYGKDRKLSND